jgi:hypothetical protein
MKLHATNAHKIKRRRFKAMDLKHKRGEGDSVLMSRKAFKQFKKKWGIKDDYYGKSREKGVN